MEQFRVNFMEVVWFVVKKWNGRIFLGDVMQSERGLFATKTWRGGELIVFVSFKESDLRCLLR